MEEPYEKNSVFLSFCHYTSCIQARLPYHMYSTLPRKHLAQLLLLFLLYDTKGLLLYTLSILTLAKNGSKWAIPAHTGQNWVLCFRFGQYSLIRSFLTKKIKEVRAYDLDIRSKAHTHASP